VKKKGRDVALYQGRHHKRGGGEDGSTDSGLKGVQGPDQREIKSYRTIIVN